MITLKYATFMGMPFSEAFNKLANQKFPAKQAYQLKLLGDKLTKKRMQISQEYLTLVERYATKDADGKIVRPNPDEPNGFDIAPDQRAAYKKDEDAFGETTFTVNVSQLRIEDLGNTEFTASELSTLDALFIAPLEEAEAPVATVTQIAPQQSEPVQAETPSSA